MVHMKIISKKFADETPERHLIQLEKSQASKVPFPPNCPVLVLDKELHKASILYSGDVTAVYVTFDHGSGSCHNCYKICYKDARGNTNLEVVSGDRIRYAINCPIKVTSKANSSNCNEAIEGSIKGFEIISEGEDEVDSAKSIPSFLYTVEVTAVGANREERTFRQHGISPEHIRYRETSFTDSESSSYQTDFEKTSIVSLDEPKTQSYDTPCKKATTPKLLLTGTFSPPCKMPTTPQTPGNRFGVGSPRLINEVTEQKMLMKCYPLLQPHPTHFQGDLNKDYRVPDFSFLTNYAPTKIGIPEGCKACVMCGEIRSCNNGKSCKTKSMKSSTKYSEDSIVIPNQNKGLCTLCDVNIWVIKSSGVQVKWCKGCKNFKAWATFGEKGTATKCLCCRERQKEKYAASKYRKRKMLDASQKGGEAKKSLTT